METTVNTEKRYLCDKETFLAMKAEQKAIANERKTGDLRRKYWSDLDAWNKKKPFVEPERHYKTETCNLGHDHTTSKPNPKYGDYLKAMEDWKTSKPIDGSVLSHSDHYARAFNIIYGMVRGKTYRQIEKTSYMGNQTWRDMISEARSIIKKYKLDYQEFMSVNYLGFKDA